MASSGRTPVKRVDRRPLTAAPEPPLARGGARRARACSSRYVASAGPRARAGATGRAGCVPPRRRQHVTDMALDHSPPRHDRPCARHGCGEPHGRPTDQPTTTRKRATAVAACATTRPRPPTDDHPLYYRPTPGREERAPLESSEEGARDAAGSHLGRLGPFCSRGLGGGRAPRGRSDAATNGPPAALPPHGPWKGRRRQAATSLGACWDRSAGRLLWLPGCIIRYVRRVYVPRLARVL